MSDNDRAFNWLTFAVAMIGVGAFFLQWKMEKLKTQAVQKGFAEWVVDSKGNAKWQWKEARR